MTNITDPFRQIFLAGVGALAMGADKTQEVLDALVQKGQITVDQGKEIASELKSDAADRTADLRDQIIRAQMQTMTKEQRDAFAARVAEMAASVDEDDAMCAEEADEGQAAASRRQ